MGRRIARRRAAAAALAAVLLGAGAAAEAEAEAIGFSLVAAGVRCSAARDVASDADSADRCAELACADAQCGALFEFNGQTRRCSCLEAGQTCHEMKDPGFSRFQITDTSNCQTVVGTDCFATLHENGDFSGWSASFPQGTHGAGAFEAAGAVPRSASALFVSPGCIATLFERSDFSGWSATMGEGSHTIDELLAAGARDDEVSAIGVRHPTAPDPLRAAAPAPPAPAGRAPPAAVAGSKRPPPAPRPPPRSSGGAIPPSQPAKRCSISVAKQLGDWACKLASRQGCSKEELAFLDEAEHFYALKLPAGAPPRPTWQGDLERVESEALRLYYTRNNIPKDQRPWVLRQITILLHLCARGEGQTWGFHPPRSRREEL